VSQPPPGASVPVVPTVACEACGQQVELRAATCPRCGFPRDGLAMMSLAQPIRGKSPRSAMWLSLAWPGGGHYYAGDREKALIYSGVAVACGLLSFVVGPVLALVVWLGLALHTAIDSGRLVSGSRGR